MCWRGNGQNPESVRTVIELTFAFRRYPNPLFLKQPRPGRIIFKQEICIAMAANIHPVLQEYVIQIPDSIKTYQSIQQQKSYEEIAAQARNEMVVFKSLDDVLEDGRTVQDVLQQSGSLESIENPEPLEDDRLRVVGVLNMIAEFCEDMAED